MTKSEFLDYMERFFNSLERSACYYWEYKDKLIEFQLINKLAFSNSLINVNVYNKTNEFIERELKRYV